MLLDGEVGDNGIGDAAVAHLDRVAVLDKPGDVLADTLGDFRVRIGGVLQERFVVVHEKVHIVDVNERVAVHAGHVRVDLCHDHASDLGGGLHDVHAHPETHVAVLIGKRGLNERHIHPVEAAVEQARHLGEKDGRVVGQARVHGTAGAVADKEGVEAEIGLELLVGVGGHTQGPHAENLGVEKSLGVALDVADHRMNQVLGLGAGRGDENRVPPVDVAEDGFFSREFRRVAKLPGIKNGYILFHGSGSLSGLRIYKGEV